MTRPLPCLLLALCLALLAFPRPAQADDPAMRAAKRHYERGQKLFTLQKFDDALEQYQKAFDAKPIPDFLFNIAQCQRNLGDYQAAVFSFKRFLKLDPEAPNREKVEALIEDLEERLAAGESKRFRLDRRRDDEQPQPGATPIYKKWWFWTGVAVVGVVGGVGIYAATSGDGAPPADYGPIDFDK